MIFTLFTTLNDITGHEEATGFNRPKGVEHGGHMNRKNWAERRQHDFEFKDKEPAVMILGE